jgi:hypothetical protein
MLHKIPYVQGGGGSRTELASALYIMTILCARQPVGRNSEAYCAKICNSKQIKRRLKLISSTAFLHSRP